MAFAVCILNEINLYFIEWRQLRLVLVSVANLEAFTTTAGTRINSAAYAQLNEH
jgi:hypothetical protein